MSRGRGRGWAAAHLGGEAGTPVGLACGAAWVRVCGASSSSPWPLASPSCRSRPCGEPSGSQALVTRPNRAGPGLGQGGTERSGSGGCDVRSRGSCPDARRACSIAPGLDPVPPPSDIGRRAAATATTAAELKPPAADRDFRLRTTTSGSMPFFRLRRSQYGKALMLSE